MPPGSRRTTHAPLSIGVTVVVSLFGVVFGRCPAHCRSCSTVYSPPSMPPCRPSPCSSRAWSAARAQPALPVRLLAHRSHGAGLQRRHADAALLLCLPERRRRVPGGGRHSISTGHRLRRDRLRRRFVMFFYEFRANRRIGSDFVRLDAQSWLMSAESPRPCWSRSPSPGRCGTRLAHPRATPIRWFWRCSPWCWCSCRSARCARPCRSSC